MVMVGGLLYAGAGAAQSSKDYAVMARAARSAFECSSLAGAFEDFQEQQRLFSFGYDQGKRFLAALEAKKVKGDDLNSEAPLVLLLLLAGQVRTSCSVESTPRQSVQHWTTFTRPEESSTT
jgi:hypothetical protein